MSIRTLCLEFNQLLQRLETYGALEGDFMQAQQELQRLQDENARLEREKTQLQIECDRLNRFFQKTGVTIEEGDSSEFIPDQEVVG